MRVLLAAGGTAGHINPALSIAQELCRRFPGCEVCFAGRKTGMEYRLVTEAGFAFRHIEVHGIQRSFGPKNVLRNASAVWHLAFAPHAAAKILKEFQPDLVVGTGGYVSGPVLREAARRGIPTAIHEQNAYPGVTNRILARSVDLVMVVNQSALDRIGRAKKTLVTGNPVAPAFYSADRQAARRAIHAGERLVLVSYGGSNGAMRINEMVAHLAKWHIAKRNFLHIHATGKIERESFAQMAAAMAIDHSNHFQIREYLDSMPQLLSAADLVICRAGALTLAELAAAGRASILVPSPNVAENHQYYNALEYQKAGAARVVQESQLTPKGLIELVDELTADPETLRQMGEAAKTLDRPGALAAIVDGLEGLVCHGR